MKIRRLWLRNFRSWTELDLAWPEGRVVVSGANGAGKTNLVEAIVFLAELSSFRGVPSEALVKRPGVGESTVIRGEIAAGGRDHLIEIELAASGRTRVLLNRQRARRRDLLEAFRVTVFSPDDLELIKGGPAVRRRLLDQIMVGLRPADDQLRVDLERVLRQRNSLLKGGPRRWDDAARLTLDVWDTKLAEVGSIIAQRRSALVGALIPGVQAAVEEIAGSASTVSLRYLPAWEGELAAALGAAREQDIRRGVSTVGPHRDDLEILLDGRPARTHASQGEQRSLALAVRLAGHRAITEAAGDPPVLVLDDVFSELDDIRRVALLGALHADQALLTTASVSPADTASGHVVHIAMGEEGSRVASLPDGDPAPADPPGGGEETR